MMDINAARKRAEEALERAERASNGTVGIAGILRDAALEDVTYKTALECREIVRSDVPQLAQDLLDALEEIERLTDCLKRANQQAEHFEREWYLRGDEIEELKRYIDA